MRSRNKKGGLGSKPDPAHGFLSRWLMVVQHIEQQSAGAGSGNPGALGKLGPIFANSSPQALLARAESEFSKGVPGGRFATVFPTGAIDL